MKKIFLVIELIKNGKNRAIAETIRTGENLIMHINKYKNNYEVNTILLCESRKQAEQVAIEWNNSYKANGTNLF